MSATVHTSRWPPSAAVRQRTMARSTLTCFQPNPLTVSLDECVARDADEIGHLEGWPAQLFRSVVRLSASANPKDWQSRADDAAKDGGRWWSLSRSLWPNRI